MGTSFGPSTPAPCTRTSDPPTSVVVGLPSPSAGAVPVRPPVEPVICRSTVIARSTWSVRGASTASRTTSSSSSGTYTVTLPLLPTFTEVCQAGPSGGMPTRTSPLSITVCSAPSIVCRLRSARLPSTIACWTSGFWAIRLALAAAVSSSDR